jgi:hypothetical protein
MGQLPRAIVHTADPLTDANFNSYSNPKLDGAINENGAERELMTQGEWSTIPDARTIVAFGEGKKGKDDKDSKK